MSSKKAPLLSVEQRVFEANLLAILAKEQPGTTIGLGRNDTGGYHSMAARTYWALWRTARDEVSKKWGGK